MTKPKAKKREPKPITAQPVGQRIIGGSRVQGDRNVQIGSPDCYYTPMRKPQP